VYDWAGEIRTVNISKPGAAFAFAFILPQALQQFAANLARERHLDGLAKDAFISRLAYHFGELNAIHPFREGNGRTQREFFRQLALRRGYVLQWDLATPDEMLHASKRSFHGDHAPMTALLTQVLRAASATEARAPWRKLPTA
jgi:cell filamentation protein